MDKPVEYIQVRDRLIPKLAIIDKEDFHLVKNITWSLLKWGDRLEYARSDYHNPESNIKRKRTLMHHLIIGKPKGKLMVDHINGNGLDNRKCNLRFVTNSENQLNSINHRSIKQRHMPACGGGTASPTD